MRRIAVTRRAAEIDKHSVAFDPNEGVGIFSWDFTIYFKLIKFFLVVPNNVVSFESMLYGVR
jgi:hypothetical protein